jgi:hypothetical protein
LRKRGKPASFVLWLKRRSSDCSGGLCPQEGKDNKACLTPQVVLFFLPVGVLQYRDTFTISAEVSVLRRGRKFGPLTLESRVAADHTLFSGPESYAAHAEQLALEDLAARLSGALAQHPDWFSP